MKEENEAIIKALNMYGRVPKQWELLNEIERLKLIIATAIRIYEKCEETQDYSTCDLDMYEVLKGVHNDR